MERKNILVTGGAGFIGSHLVDELVKKGHKVVVVDNLSTGKKENLNPKVKFYKINICSPKISRIFQKEKPEAVFHFAAQIDVRKSVEDPIGDAKVNILGSLNVLHSFCNSQHSHKLADSHYAFIFASSGGAIYGDTNVIPTPEDHRENPESPYGIAKLSVEKYLHFYRKTYGLNYVSLRFANVYGPRQNSKGEAGVVAIFADKMLALYRSGSGLAPYRTKGSGLGLAGKQPTINGSGVQTRDFVYVKDVVQAGILALKKDKVGIFNIGTARETDINTIFRKLKELTGSNRQEIHGPVKPGEQKRSCLSYQKAKKELGWQPKYDLEKGLKETINYFRNEH